MSWKDLAGGAKVECLAYGIVAVLAFAGTQSVLIYGIVQGRMSGNQVWYDLRANPTAMFVSIDLLMVFLAAMIYMVVEGRRLGVRWWLLYPVLSTAIGVSFGFPLFLIARRLRLAGGSRQAVGG